MEIVLEKELFIFEEFDEEAKFMVEIVKEFCIKEI